MDKTYIKLFAELARATEIAAEQVMEYDKEKNDTKGEETARLMRDDYASLHDRLSSEDFDGILTKNDFLKLEAGAYIVTNNLRDKIAGIKKAITGYEVDLIPKLQKVAEATSDTEAQSKADELFILNDNK